MRHQHTYHPEPIPGPPPWKTRANHLYSGWFTTRWDNIDFTSNLHCKVAITGISWHLLNLCCDGCVRSTKMFLVQYMIGTDPGCQTDQVSGFKLVFILLLLKKTYYISKFHMTTFTFYQVRMSCIHNYKYFSLKKNK